MTTTDSTDVAAILSVEDLRPTFLGRVIGPDDPDYDRARTVMPGGLGDDRPAVIVKVANADDVVRVIELARQTGLDLAVRSGGHSAAGHGVVDGGIVLDVSDLKSIDIDVDGRTVWAGSGLTAVELLKALDEHGLGVGFGDTGSVGIAGITLGGGVGYLGRKYGLTIDDLIAAEIVTADGAILEIDADHDPDLFWAIRGGGGNFGVVTEFTFRAHPVGPMVHVGLLFWPLDQGTAALRLVRDVLRSLPSGSGALLGVGLSAPPAPFVPEQHHFVPGHALILAGFGTAEEHAALVDPIRAALPPLFDFVSPIPYPVLQSMLDDAAPPGILGYERALYLDDLTDEVIAVMTEFSAKKSSPMSFSPTFQLGGAFAEVDDAATAFGGERRAGYVVNLAGIASTPDLLEADTAWVRAYWEALLPHSRGTGSYVNFMVEPDQDRVLAAYGAEKYQRLAKIKAQYDPANVFRHTANIKPAG
jgi:FAD/FMN-containing dehydrogenase